MTNEKNTKKKVNWTKAQLTGIYIILVIGATFWFGTYIGTQATLNSQAQQVKVETQAVNDYKATLKPEQ